jgi:hypothetical protein
MTKIDVLSKYLMLTADEVDRLNAIAHPSNEFSLGDLLRADLAKLQPKKPAPVSVPISFDSKTGTFSGITEFNRKLWAAACPAVNLDQELAAAAAWLIANPKKAPRSNYNSFLTAWMNRTQQKGGTRGFVQSQSEDKAEAWAKS